MNNSKYAFLCAVIALGGCSSIIEGRSQELVINTNPPGATCSLERNGMPIGTVSPTPSAILVEKTKYDILVKCDKDGYEQATYFNKSGAAGATFGNIILGGGIGWAINSATGSDNKYDSPMNITLSPMLASGHAAKKTPHVASAAMPANIEALQQPVQESASASDYPTGK